MARCMLCAADVPGDAVTCPHCGGAVEADDPTRVDDVPTTAVDPTAVAGAGDVAPWDRSAGPAADPAGLPSGPPGGDPHPHDRWQAPGAPPFGSPADPAAPWAPPGPPVADGPPQWGAPSSWDAPGPWGAPGGPGPGYGAPGGPTPGYGGPAPQGAPGYGPPAYGAPAYGPVPYGAQGYGAPGYGNAVPFVPPRPSEGIALASLLTSIIGLATAAFCYFPILACPVGAILGHVALARIARTGNQGRGLALAGIIIGWFGTALFVAVLLVAAAAVWGSS